MSENGPFADEDVPVAPIELIPLGGGVANAGAVFRRGDVVVRPSGPQTNAVQALMRQWRNAGVSAVPEPLGVEVSAETGETNELVSFVPGRVASPTTEWAAELDALAAVATTQRDLHDAAKTFAAPEPDGPWGAQGYIPDQVAPPQAHAVIACHNDLCVSNIVFAAEELSVAGVIDWDYAQPVDPLFDVAVAMRHWVPFSTPADRTGAWADVDTTRRFHLWAQIMDLPADTQHRVLDIAIMFLDRAHVNVAQLAARGVGGFQTLIDDGYLDRNRRDREWIVASRPVLVASN